MAVIALEVTESRGARLEDVDLQETVSTVQLRNGEITSRDDEKRLDWRGARRGRTWDR